MAAVQYVAGAVAETGRSQQACDRGKKQVAWQEGRWQVVQNYVQAEAE